MARSPPRRMSASLLEVEGLSVTLGTGAARRTPVVGVSFQVEAGQALGIVGESGSGKTLSLLALLGLLPAGAQAHAARACFDGQDLLRLEPGRLRAIRGGEIAMVFQDALGALNPVLTIGRQIGEVVRTHLGLGGAPLQPRVRELLASVGIPEPQLRARQYPHELSGGMRQRAGIAMALAGEPRLLVLDEPTTALDVTIQAEIVAMIKRRQLDTGLALIWVTHDLPLLARIADQVAVMYAGRIVENAPVDRLFGGASHPYARSLLASARGQARLASSELRRQDDPPAGAGAGCAYAMHCPEVHPKCRSAAPPAIEIESAHRVSCWARTVTGRAGDRG